MTTQTTYVCDMCSKTVAGEDVVLSVYTNPAKLVPGWDLVQHFCSRICLLDFLMSEQPGRILLTEISDQYLYDFEKTISWEIELRRRKAATTERKTFWNLVFGRFS